MAICGCFCLVGCLWWFAGIALACGVLGIIVLPFLVVVLVSWVWWWVGGLLTVGSCLHLGAVMVMGLGVFHFGGCVGVGLRGLDLLYGVPSGCGLGFGVCNLCGFVVVLVVAQLVRLIV